MAYEEYFKNLPRLSSRFDADQALFDKTNQLNLATQKQRDDSEFNWGNALVRAATAMMAAGGPTNPMAWVAAGGSALGAEKGKEFKPLESAVSGYTSGATAGMMPGGGDLAKTGSEALKLSNLGTTLPFLKSVMPGNDPMANLGDIVAKQQAEKTRLGTLQSKQDEVQEARRLKLMGNTSLTPEAIAGLGSGLNISDIVSNQESYKIPEVKSEALLSPFKQTLNSITSDPNTSVWDKRTALIKGNIKDEINQLPSDVRDTASKEYANALSENTKEISNMKSSNYLQSIMKADDNSLNRINNAIQNDQFLTANDKKDLFNKIDDKKNMSKRELRQEQQILKSDEKYLKAQERADARALKQDERSLKQDEKSNKMLNIAEQRLNRQDRETIAKRRLTDDYSRAVQGLTSIDRAMETYSKNPGVASIVNVPGRKLGIGEAGKFETDLKNAQDILMRIRTGAAISAKEGKIYDTITNPQWFNDPANRLNKMQTLKDVYAEIIKRIEDPYRTPVNIQNILNKSKVLPISSQTDSSQSLLNKIEAIRRGAKK